MTRYQNGQIEDILKLIDDANRAIEKELLKTSGIATKKRYRDILKVLNKVSRDLKSNSMRQLDDIALIQNELQYQRKVLSDDGLADFIVPDEKQIRTAVQFAPFAENTNFSAFLESVQEGLYNTWDNAMRTGYMTGMTTQQIIRKVMGAVPKNGMPATFGTMEAFRNSVARNTRTYLQAMASTARDAMFEENESLFSGFKYVATLDTRTCIVCGALDGKVFQNIKEVPRTPRHYNCRCTVVPIVKGFEGWNPSRASKNGYVKGNLTYSQWLKTLTNEEQRKVLGATRYRIFKKEGGKLDKFVNDGKIRTLDQLL